MLSTFNKFCLASSFAAILAISVTGNKWALLSIAPVAIAGRDMFRTQIDCNRAIETQKRAEGVILNLTIEKNQLIHEQQEHLRKTIAMEEEFKYRDRVFDSRLEKELSKRSVANEVETELVRREYQLLIEQLQTEKEQLKAIVYDEIVTEISETIHENYQQEFIGKYQQLLSHIDQLTEENGELVEQLDTLRGTLGEVYKSYLPQGNDSVSAQARCVSEWLISHGLDIRVTDCFREDREFTIVFSLVEPSATRVQSLTRLVKHSAMPELRLSEQPNLVACQEGYRLTIANDKDAAVNNLNSGIVHQTLEISKEQAQLMSRFQAIAANGIIPIPKADYYGFVSKAEEEMVIFLARYNQYFTGNKNYSPSKIADNLYGYTKGYATSTKKCSRHLVNDPEKLFTLKERVEWIIESANVPFVNT